MVSLSEIVRYLLSSQIIQILLGKKLFPVNESLHRRPALTAFPLMSPLMVVMVYILIQIRLQDIQIAVYLLSKNNPVKLVQNRLVKPLANTIGLRTSCLGLCVFNLIEL